MIRSRERLMTARMRPVLPGAAVAAGLVALAFLTSASADPSAPTADAYSWSLIALVLLGTGACAAAIVAGGREPWWGAAPIALFAAFTALAGISIAWSVQPDWSWYGADQLGTYLMTFSGAAALARLVPERWAALLGAIAVATVALSGWSLLVKVFPATLDPSNVSGRLLAPFSYWNAIGVCAALGIPACLWAGTRPGAARVGRAAAVPGLTVVITVVVLSYSRSAVLAALVGGGLWMLIAPRRLHSAAVLAVAAAGALPIVAWDLHRPALTADAIALAAQDQAGHSFGVVIALALVLTAVAGVGLAIGAERARLTPERRRRAGAALIGLAALIPVAGILALAASSRGLTGQISHAWNSLTNTSPGVGDTSSRLSQLGSSRPLYWGQALRVGEHHLLAGAGELGYGVARLRYTDVIAKTDHAHGYVFQTFADLGLVGIALSAALLIAWGRAALRPIAALRPATAARLPAEMQDERTGLVALLAIVVAFGCQSLLDWTLYFAGVSVPALLCAGWLAGRGPLTAPVGRAANRRRLLERPAAGAALIGLAVLALAGAWLIWAPQHSDDEIIAAQNATSNRTAFDAARSAATADPLSTQPLLELSILYQGVKDNRSARAELVKAAQLQPDNPESWVWLGLFDIQNGHPHAALADAARIQMLDHAQDPAGVVATQIIAEAPKVMAAQRAARRHRRHR